MILHEKRVVQIVDRDERARFIKELIVVHAGASGAVPLAMIRKRAESDAGGTLAPILLVHGYGQNRYAWHLPSRSLSNHLARAGFDVFNLDLRGHGRSRYLGARRPGHVSEFVREDIPAALAEVRRLSGDRPIYYVGHSLGGLVGYACANDAGDALAGLVSLGSPYAFTRGSWALAALGSLMLGVDRRLSLGDGALGLKHWGEAVRLLRGFVESPFFPSPIRGFAPRSMEPNVLAQHMSLAMDQGSVTVLRNMFLDAAESRRTGHRLGGLSGYASAFESSDLPLLVVAGARDDLAPPSSVEPAFERSRSRDKTYRVFPRGHIDLVVGRDAPLTVWPLVEAWIKTRIRGAVFEGAASDPKPRPSNGQGA